MNSFRVEMLMALASVFVCSVSLASHPFHVSLAEMERNAKSGNYEVSLCVWPADLEKALSQMTERSIDLDKESNLDELIGQYLQKKIEFTSTEGERAKLRFVGHEIDLQKGWLYFEVQTGTGQEWKFQNRVFFELNDDQINHFNLKTKGDVQSNACTLDQPEYPLKQASKP